MTRMQRVFADLFLIRGHPPHPRHPRSYFSLAAEGRIDGCQSHPLVVRMRTFAALRWTENDTRYLHL